MEGDEIAVNNESSYNIFLKLNSNRPKIYCELETKKSQVEEIGNITCSFCSTNLIGMIRYRCIECNFDLCLRCESEKLHEKHILVKSSDNENGTTRYFCSFFLEQENIETEVHRTVSCDHCHEKPITGFRYKCVECLDYDLCSNCHSKDVHNHHVFIRMPFFREVERRCF